MSASIEIGIQELLLSGKGTNTSSARNVKVRVQLPNDVVTHALETAPVNIINQAQPVRFDWAHHVPLTERGRSWEALKKALDLARVKPGAARVEYHLINASSGAELGSGQIDLAPLAAAPSEEPMQRVYLVDTQRHTVGTLVVRVKARDAVQLVGASGKHAMDLRGGGPKDTIDADVKRAFNQFDTDNSGDIDATELHDALATLGMNASGSQARAILQRYTTGGRNALKLPEFARLVTDLRQHQGKDPISPASSKKYGSGASGGGVVDRDIRAAFDAFDTDHSGDIDQHELRGALKKLGMHNIDAAATDQVLKRYSNRGSLKIDEFARMVADLRAFQGKDPISPSSSFKSNRSSGGKWGGGGGGGADPNIRAAFEAFDTDGSGGIDKDELVEALKQLGMNSDGMGAQAILNKYAGPGKGDLNLSQFEQLVGDLERFQRGSGGAATTPIRKTTYAKSQIDPKIRAAFEQFDTDHSGDIDQHELVRALRQLGMDATKQQAADVLARYDTINRDGSLDIFEFDRLVRDLNRFQGGGGSLGGGGGYGGASRTTYGGPTTVDQRIRDAFNRFDTDRSGDIDRYELEKALRELGMSATPSQVAQVLKRYDTQKSDGKLDLYEFEALVKDLERYQSGGSLGGGGQARFDPNRIDPKVKAAFERFDADRNGTIDAGELREALRNLGVSADGSQAVAILKRYDADRSGGIELVEFARMVHDLIDYQGGGTGDGEITHEIKRVFAEFDTDRSGTIDAKELARCLQMLGIETNDSQANAILRQYDADGNRTLDLREFARLVKDIRNFQEGGGSDAVRKQLQRQDVLHLFRSHRNALDELFYAYALEADDSFGAYATGYDTAEADIRAAFAEYDRDASGGIDSSELVGALAKLGLQASSQQAIKVLARYDTDGSRQLELPEFKQLVNDLKTFQAGGTQDYKAQAAETAYPKVLYPEELLSMVHGFRLIPKYLLADDVRSAVREMQTSSTADVGLLPIKKANFDEVLLRIAHYAAAKSHARSAEAAKRLDELFRLFLLYDVPRMRALVSEHRLREACSVGDIDVCRELIGKRVAIDARDYDNWTALHRACVYGHEECVGELIAASASIPQLGPHGFTAMHFAAEYGQVRVVHMLLHAKAAPAELTAEQGWTPLQRAAIDGHDDVVKALLSASKDKRTGNTNYPIMSRDKAGDTALHDASRNGHLGVVRELVLAKADLNSPNHAGQTALDVAKKAGRKDVAEFLTIKLRAANKGGGPIGSGIA